MSPHFLYEFLVIGTDKFFQFRSLKLSAQIVTTLSYCMLSIILYYGFLAANGIRKTSFSKAFRLFAVLGVMIACPVPAFYFYDGYMYLGYFGINSYHNPTIILLKPFAALQLIYVAKAYDEDISSSRVYQAILTSLSAIAKPSYLICLIPAAAIMWVMRSIKKQRVSRKFLLLGIGLPGILVLLWQFYFQYGNGTTAIIFSPLRVYSKYSEIWMLIPKLALTIIFPLSVAVCFRDKVSICTLLYFAWIMYGVGIAYACIFAEVPKMYSGNFFWSAEITGFLLFASSTKFFLSEIDAFRTLEKIVMPTDYLRNIKMVIPGIAFLLQFASGLIIYFKTLHGESVW